MTVVMIAAEVTRPSDIDAIQSKLMRNAILMILLTDLMVKYDANTTLEINISNINLVNSHFETLKRPHIRCECLSVADINWGV